MLSELAVETARVPGILVIEGNARLLRRQGHLKVIDSFAKGVASSVAEGKLRFRRFSIRTAADLLLGTLSAEYARYNAVVLVAHGSLGGVEAAPSSSLTWEDAGKALAPLEPRVLLGISCFAANSFACDALFRAIPTLDVIIGSSTTLAARDTQVALLEMFFEAHGVEIAREMSALGTVFNALVHGGIVFRRTRAGFTSQSMDESVREDLLVLLVATMRKFLD